jgi:hypothetical protein
MQTLAFLWYELEAAKRHVREILDEPEERGRADLPVRSETQWTGIKSTGEGVSASHSNICAQGDFCRSSDIRTGVRIPIARGT